MPASAPIVSVCIPTYRGATFVGQAIESVLGQTFGEFELLVVDDNSPDETASVVSGYRDSRIRLLRNMRNLGPEGNWNRCLDEARGRYFKLLPQDDVLAPECLARQAAVLEADAHQQIALVFCARNILDPGGRVLLRRGIPGRHSGTIPAGVVIRRCLRRGTNLIGEPGGVLFRMSLAKQVGGFDADAPYLIDLDYWARLLCHGDAHYFPEPLASFRVSNESWSVAIGNKQTADFGRFMSKTARIPAFAIGPFDILAGRAMARLNTYLRLILYRFVLNRKAPA
ncbi:MAG: glycosyltransferase [Bryobacteraceae bacterium]